MHRFRTIAAQLFPLLITRRTACSLNSALYSSLRSVTSGFIVDKTESFLHETLTTPVLYDIRQHATGTPLNTCVYYGGNVRIRRI